MQSSSANERRRSRRIRIGQPVKVRPSDPKDKYFEDKTETKNVSRSGIYFVSSISSYYEGMRLFLIVPHHMPRDAQDREYLGQVVRVEALAEGRWGVAVNLL